MHTCNWLLVAAAAVVLSPLSLAAASASRVLAYVSPGSNTAHILGTTKRTEGTRAACDFTQFAQLTIPHDDPDVPASTMTVYSIGGNSGSVLASAAYVDIYGDVVADLKEPAPTGELLMTGPPAQVLRARPAPTSGHGSVQAQLEKLVHSIDSLAKAGPPLVLEDLRVQVPGGNMVEYVSAASGPLAEVRSRVKPGQDGKDFTMIAIAPVHQGSPRFDKDCFWQVDQGNVVLKDYRLLTAANLATQGCVKYQFVVGEEPLNGKLAGLDIFYWDADYKRFETVLRAAWKKSI